MSISVQIQMCVYERDCASVFVCWPGEFTIEVESFLCFAALNSSVTNSFRMVPKGAFLICMRLMYDQFGLRLTFNVICFYYFHYFYLENFSNSLASSSICFNGLYLCMFCETFPTSAVKIWPCLLQPSLWSVQNRKTGSPKLFIFLFLFLQLGWWPAICHF